MTASRSAWGAEQSLFMLADALKKRGLVVDLVCFPGTIEAEWARLIGHPAILADAAAPENESKIKENLILWRTYRKTARKFDRVVLFTYYLLVGVALNRVLLAGQRIKIALDLHDNLPGERGRQLLRLFARGVQSVVACSAFTASQLDSVPTEVHVIHGPAEALAVRTQPSAVKRIGILGRIVKEKQHLLLAEAVAGLSDESVLIIRGSGDGSVNDNSAEVRKYCLEVLGPRFIDEGKVEQERVLDDLDIVVVANHQEPMGRTVLEAQLSGVFAVVPDQGGSSELVEDQQTGRLYASGDAAQLREVLASIDPQSDSARQICERARQRAQHTVTPEMYADSYLLALE